MRTIKVRNIRRIIDANFNRAKEGLRVCEDTARFILNDSVATRHYKNLRHRLETLLKNFSTKHGRVIEARDIARDVGRGSTKPEFKRKNVSDVFYANSQRVKESIRVLEEFMKIVDVRHAQAFKEIRYAIYALEKKIVKKL